VKTGNGRPIERLNMKEYLAKVKKIVGSYPYLLFATLFLSVLLLVSLSGPAESDEKNSKESFTPVLIIVEGVEMGPGEEVSLHLSQKLVRNDFGVTVGITPYLNKKELTASDSLVRKLRQLYDRYPENIGFALQGLEHLENEFKKPLPEQIHILSRA